MSTQSTIYILKGWTCYEDDDLIAAYESKSEADAEAARLNKLRQEQPIAPDLHDSEEEWGQYYAVRGAWVTRFPEQHLASCDGFDVRELDFIAAAKPACPGLRCCNNCLPPGVASAETEGEEP